jgi:hypothetical protein
MNERIRELAVQAGIATNLETDFFEKDANKWVDYYSIKFAELMVEEFDLILANEYLDCVGENDKKSQFRVARLRKRVEEYFGVEE